MSLDQLTALTNTALDGCMPCKQRQQQQTHSDSPVTPSGTTPSGGSQWSGVIGVEGEMTGDGRLIEPNALRWENLPIPLRYVSSDNGAHDGAVVVGRITSITRGQDGQILATGDFDTSSEHGQEAFRQVQSGLTTGVSMDLDEVSFEVRVASDLLDDSVLPLMMSAEEPTHPDVQVQDSEGRVTVMEINADDEIRVTTSGRIRAATIVAIPAFASASIHLTDATTPTDTVPEPPAGLMPDGTTPCSCDDTDPAFDPDCVCDVPDPALVAAAAPLAPPAAWFSNPRLTGPTPLAVTADGRLFGHLATWNTCHLSHTAQGQCVTPPRTGSGYAYFHTGSVMTAEGAEVPVGHITLDTRHAGERLTPAATLAHYENTGAVVADVAAGEDEHGIWVAGAVRPTATENQVRALRSAPLSGDWRRIANTLELVAALAVNVPGFPVPRPAGLVAGGVVTSLVASGMLAPRKVRPPGTPGALSVDDLRYLKKLADRERAEEQTLQASGSLPDPTALARRVRASSLAMRAHRPTG